MDVVNHATWNLLFDAARFKEKFQSSVPARRTTKNFKHCWPTSNEQRQSLSGASA